MSSTGNGEWRPTTSAVVLVVLLILVLGVGAMVLPAVFRIKRGRTQGATCLANLKCIALHLLTYAQDYDGRLPPASTWGEGVRPYVGNAQVMVCPGDSTRHQPGYAYNSRLSCLMVDDIQNGASLVSLFDSAAATPNPADCGTSLPIPARHQWHSFAFLDGHAAALPQVPAGAWVPELAPRPARRMPSR